MKKLYISILSLLVAGVTTAQVDRSKMPEPGPAPKIELGETQSFTLDNGLKVFVVENHKLPRVAFSLQLDVDPITEGDKVGAAEIAGDLMSKGTTNRSKDEINFEVDFIGANLSTSAFGVYGASLKKHQDKLLDVMSDVVMNADFKEEELEKLKKQYISGIQTEKDDPDAIASKVRRVLLYGKDHPYGEIMTEETVENITLQDAKDYYGTYYKPNVSYLAVVGDITLKEAKPLVKKYFGKWQKGEVPSHEYEMPEKPKMTKLVFVNKPGAVQSVVSVFNTIDLKPGSEDAIPASIANGILGGGFVSKLNLNLREEHAYTYGARSSISSDELVGYFNASAKVRNEVTDSALTEMLNEITAMLKGDITKDELTAIKNYRTGTFSYSLENPQTKARFALNTEKYDLPDDYYATYLKKVADVTLDDVKSVSKKYIQPLNGYILIVGNQEEVADKLKKFSPSGEIHYYDTYGNEAQETSMKAAPEGVTEETVINDYIEAIGGKKSLEKVESMKMSMKTSMQGMEITMVSYNGKNGEFMTETKTPMGSQKQIYDGEKAQMSSVQGKKMMNEEQTASLKYESIIFPELNYLNSDYKLELKGIDTFNDLETYVVTIEKPNGEKSTNYYATDSGLLIGSTTLVESPQGSFTQETIFSNYKEQKGVKYPFSMTQSFGPQKMEITVEELEVNPKLDTELFKIEE